MNQYVTGSTIKELREEKKITQQELADMLYVSAKTISKWETGKGFPDVSILEDLALALNVSITELFSGERVINTNTHANMLNVRFYICPICGNVIFSIGESKIICHGIELQPLEPEDIVLDYEIIEDEIYVNIDSKMTHDDHISFIAGVSADKVELKKLYVEGGSDARLKLSGLKYIYYYSNRNGLFRFKYSKIKTR
ncbi:MAG: helix-turn-helix domain-containing protein [Anaeroplasmataceae bacterium]